MDEIIIDGKIASYRSAVFEELRKLCGTSNTNTEQLAATRYFKKQNIIRGNEPNDPQIDKKSDSEDAEFTAFGDVPTKGEKYTVDIAGMYLFWDNAEAKIKQKTQFNDHLILLIFEKTRKPCCWSLGHVFTQSGEVKIHAVCLNENCKATLIVFTENQQKSLRIIIYSYDPNISHSKKRYVTGNDEKKD